MLPISFTGPHPKEMRISSHNYPWCAVCSRPVDAVLESYVLVTRAEHVIDVACHGSRDALRIGSFRLFDGEALIAFRAEASERVRLRNEDAALAACGLKDPEVERLDIEDSAIEALQKDR